MWLSSNRRPEKSIILRSLVGSNPVFCIKFTVYIKSTTIYTPLMTQVLILQTHVIKGKCVPEGVAERFCYYSLVKQLKINFMKYVT